LINEIVLAHLIYNEEFGRRVLPFLREEYFQDPIEKKLFSITKKYIDTYNNFPTKEALFIDASQLKSTNEEESKALTEKIKGLKHNPETDIQWLIDQTEKFCQKQSIYNGLMESIQIMDKKPEAWGSIPNVMQDALSVSFDLNIGHDFIDDWEDRYELYHRIEHKIPFDLEYFNEITRGGFSRKTLNLILGGPGIGKTLVMCHFAASNLMLGKNVLYLTMEMAQERIAERIDANILKIKVDDLESIPKDVYKNLIDGVRGRTQGKLVIKEYPTAGAGANHFRILLDELRLKKNFVPDIIYVDYINICSSSRVRLSSNVNSFSYVKAISEELRGLAVEYNVPVVSATQINREGHKDGDPGMTHISESWGIAMTADFMVVLIVNEDLEALGQYMVKQVKNRYRDPTKLKKFVIGVDRSKMRLYDAEAIAQKNISQNIISNEDPQKRGSKFDLKKFEDWK
jgi:replicative DNA helicase